MKLNWNREELPLQWKSQLWYLLTKRVIKLASNYRGISLLSTSRKILSNLLLSRLTPYAYEIIGDHQCGFRRNRSTTDQIFYIRQIPKEKWEYNGTVRQLFIDFKKAYGSLRKEVLYNVLTEFRTPRKLAGLIKTCLNETYSTVHIGKNLSDSFLLFRMA
jgi:hypothetical protein